jgi:predicted O-methyltransferase YrrM
MSLEHTGLNEPLGAYLRSVSLRDSDLLRRLREETAALTQGSMQLGPEQGQFVGLLVEALGVRRAFEVGVFTGSSSLRIAMSLPPDGKLIACDMSDEWTSIARRYWRAAGVADKIDLRLGPALTTLDQLLASGHAGQFDFGFIDADKGNYRNYYERSLSLLRPGGLVVIDNVLWHGRVADASAQDADTVAIREFNAFLQADPRIGLSMLPLGDGLTMALKR